MIRLPRLRPRREFMVRPLEPDDSRAIARLHAEDFVRPWTDGEFTTLLGQPGVFGYAAVETGKPGGQPLGFVLARRASDEAEILTIAVARACRRLGLGRLLMDAVLRELHSDRAASLFLEVDEANAAAITLYRRLGFRPVGQRPDYYARTANRRGNALVMRRDLR